MKKTVESLPLLAPISVLPRPSASEWAVGAMEGAQRIIVIQFATVHGVSYFYLGAEAAKALAKELEHAAGGIIIAPAGALIK